MGSLDEGAIELRTSEAIVYVNGKRYVLPDDAAHRTLLEYLRVELELTGTKLGCGEGGCGACTVMVSHFDSVRQRVIHRAVNACLAPLYSVEGMHVITVEGIGNRRQGLHKVQEALSNSHGSQCGFCTPGFVMSMYSLLRSRKGAPSFEEIEESLAGNLCRCTGYRPIFDAFRRFAKSDASAYTSEAASAAGVEGAEGVAMTNGEALCPSTGLPCGCGKKSESNLKNGHLMKEVAGEELQKPGESASATCSTSEPIFPPELVTRKVGPLYLKGMKGLIWYRPTTLSDLLSLKRKFPDAKIVVGNTEIGIETRFKGLIYPVLIGVSNVPELNTINITADGLSVGASCTMTELLESMRESVNERPAHETSACLAFIEQLRWFAGSQIRNVASVGGNICTASPISDLNPLWIASRAEFTVIACDSSTRKVQAKDFFVGYRKVDLQKTEILLSVFLPWTRRHEFVKEFKQAHRRDDDIALVNAGMRVAFAKREGDWMVDDVSLVYGGIAAVTVCAPKTEHFLSGKPWNQQTIDGALDVLQKEVTIAENAPGGMVEFRRSLTCSFFFKFFLQTSYKLEGSGDFTHNLPASYKSAAAPYSRDPSHGTQVFEKKAKGTSVGLPVIHASAKLQVTGEAEYCDDVPLPSKGLHAALVLSSRPHAKILSIDSTAAEAHVGFAGFFTAKDVPGGNDIGPVANDEELFATSVVTAVGQTIGIVVADTYENAKAAAKLVSIVYEDLPAVFSIQEALEAKSFFPGTARRLHDGDVQRWFDDSSQCEYVREGKVQVGGQEHFYLEPNCSLVWTADGGNEVHMISSTQTPQKHQKYVAHVLGLPMSKVVCKTKRIGGGFGGKETRSAIFAAAASVPAYLLGRAVRLTVDRDVDMLVTGQRHAFLGKYKVGFTKEGKIQALDLEIYNNGGNSLDLSFSVLERAMFHSDNVYAIPNIDIKGDVCKTNLASNTAFRGFGGPQGMLITENWIEHIARVVGKRPEEVRELNFQTEGYLLHYGQRLEDCRLQRVWGELDISCDFNSRCAEVTQFNSEHRWKKRGVAKVPTKFGISFTAKFLNQAGALVQIYTDGTVLVTHGGVEMGQGLHTKMAQIAASTFEIPLSSVFISETSTDKVPNASATAASASSDLYGGAVLDACQQLKARMEPVAARKQHTSFAELANMCFLERIDLSAHGFYITPDIGFDFSVGKGKPFSYFTFGAAFAEVEIDILSGDFYTRRVDVVMDLGESLNPAIDVGQVEGAFIQGLGLVALEEVKWGDRAHPWVRPGHLFTQGPGSYKLPSANDIPIDFRISLLKDAPNSKAIFSSKAVGEPPLFLASSVFFAIKDAIAAARKESGFEGFFVLDTPATPERIRMACADQFTLRFAPHDLRPKLSI